MERFVLDPRNEVNAVVVYAYSRFYRNVLESEKKIAALEDKGINVISLTQPVPQDCLGRLMRRFCQIADEFTSDQNARHALQGLIETASKEIWPVAKAPFEYEKYEAALLGLKRKWKRIIEASKGEIGRTWCTDRSVR